jgi:uncharacterized protein YggE
MNRTPNLLAWSLAAVAAACTLVPAAGAQEPTPIDPDRGVINVSGTGSVEVPPDRVRIQFGVDVEAPTAREASTRNAELMEGVLAALRRQGGEDLDLKTVGFNVSPVYRRPAPNQASELQGYRVSNQVSAVFSEMDAIGDLLDAGLDAGANRVSGPVFLADATEDAEAEAFRMAVESARAQAMTVASALGVELGPVLRVTTNLGGSSPQPVAMAMLDAEQARARTPIEAGQSVITAQVTLQYRIIQ